MFNFKLFLLETQQRIDGIKKVHIPSIAKYLTQSSEEGGEHIHDNIIKDVYTRKLINIDDNAGPDQKWENSKQEAAEHTADTLINTAASNDPDQLKHKHTEWMVNQWKKGHIRAEDFGGRVRDTLTHFMEHSHKLPNKDINSYKHIADLDTALKPHIQVEEKGGEVSDMLDKHPGAKLIHDEPGLRVHEIHTKEASKAIRTADPECKWCTTRHEDNQNYHDSYTNPERYTPPTNKLFVVHASDDKGETHMMQFHFGSNQFNTKDNVNRGIDSVIDKFPKIKNVSSFHDMGPQYAARLIPQHKLEEWSKSSNVEERRKSASLNGPHIQNLANDSDHTVKTRIAKFNGKHLLNLVNDPDPEIRHIVSSHSGPHLKLMTKDNDLHVRMGVVSSYGDHLKDMVNDPDPSVRSKIIKLHTHDKSLIKSFINDPDANVRATLARYPGEHQKVFAKDKNISVRRKAATIPGEHLMISAKDPDDMVRYNASLQPGPHLKILIKDNNVAIRKNAAEMPGEHLKDVHKDPDDMVRMQAANHYGPHIQKLTKDKNIDIRHFIATRAANRHDGYREYLKNFVNDPNDDIRYYIAGAMGQNSKHLKILTKDKHPEVAARAKKSLKDFYNE